MTGDRSLSLRLFTPTSYRFFRQQAINYKLPKKTWIFLYHVTFLGIPKLWLPQITPKLQDIHTHFRDITDSQIFGYLFKMKSQRREVRFYWHFLFILFEQITFEMAYFNRGMDFLKKVLTIATLFKVQVQNRWRKSICHILSNLRLYWV